MKITYREGEAMILAEADSFCAMGSMLTVQLRSGKSVNFPFPSQEVLEQFFEEVLLNASDRPIRLEQTNFDPRLGELLSAWDDMYED